jgi:hypothetical protein
MKPQKTITIKELRSGAPEETLELGEKLLVEKGDGKLFELKRVDEAHEDILAYMQRLFEEVPIEGEPVKTDFVPGFLKDRG